MPRLGQLTAALVPLPSAAKFSTSQRASTDVVAQKKANALIDALPGTTLLSKTGIITFTTAVSAAAISTELFVLVRLSLPLEIRGRKGGAADVAGVCVERGGRYPWIVRHLPRIRRECRRTILHLVGRWSDPGSYPLPLSHPPRRAPTLPQRAIPEPSPTSANRPPRRAQKVKDILNTSRTAHVEAVQSRITSVGELKDVEALTTQLFELSKQTAQFEHETFALRQQAALTAEVKSVLDAWVRHEAQVREAEQRDLVQTVLANVQKALADKKIQRDILLASVAEVEGELIVFTLGRWGRRGGDGGVEAG